MEQAILTNAQKKAISLIAAERGLDQFYLSEGTALTAYYLKHRRSDDLDFFSFEEVDAQHVQEFAQFLKQELSATNLRYDRIHDRHLFFFQLTDEELKLEFVKYPFLQLEPPSTQDSIRVDSIRDIATNKFAALLDRFDPKDFVDLFFLLHTSSLQKIRGDYEKKFGMHIDDIFLGGEIAKVKRITTLPKMLISLSLQELKEFFETEAKKLSSNILER